MNRLALSVFALLGFWLVGCTDPGDPSKGGMQRLDASLEPTQAEREAYTARLMEKGRALAERELARMAAAELTYRNQTEFHALPSVLAESASGSYVKMYRNFTAYEIEDIYRSESYLFPVAYQVRFDYDLLWTTSRPSSNPKSAALSQDDTHFSVRSRSSVTRRYRANRNGDYQGDLPDLPPRPELFKRGPADSAERGAALPNRLPPGGLPPHLQGLGLTPISPTFEGLPPISGKTH